MAGLMSRICILFCAASFFPAQASGILPAPIRPDLSLSSQTHPSHIVRASSQIADVSTHQRVIDLQLGSGQQQRALYLTPGADPGAATATLIMLPGGEGNIGLGGDGAIRHADNFVVRTRDLWLAQNFAVLIPDTFDQTNLRGLRSSPFYADVIGKLIAFARSQSPAPVFLLGTSQGAIAAANGAAHAEPGTIGGVILTESVSRLGGSHETVFDPPLSDIRVPALIVANHDDRCDVAPPGDAGKIAAAINRSPTVRVIDVSGGMTRSEKTCGSLTPHGYYGIETEVVTQIAGWIKEQTGRGMAH